MFSLSKIGESRGVGRAKNEEGLQENAFSAAGNRSFRCNLKQRNCTKIPNTSSIVCTWTGKTFGVNILRSLSQVRETFSPLLNKLVSKRPVTVQPMERGRQRELMWFLFLSNFIAFIASLSDIRSSWTFPHLNSYRLHPIQCNICWWNGATWNLCQYNLKGGRGLSVFWLIGTVYFWHKEAKSNTWCTHLGVNFFWDGREGTFGRRAC